MCHCAPYLQRGGAIDLVAVAEGGSEEALEWAVAALTAAAGEAPEVGGGMGGVGNGRADTPRWPA